MVEAHVAHAVDGRFDVFDGIPRELTLGDLRQFLVELVVQLEKSFNCLRSMAIRC